MGAFGETLVLPEQLGCINSLPNSCSKWYIMNIVCNRCPLFASFILGELWLGRYNSH